MFEKLRTFIFGRRHDEQPENDPQISTLVDQNPTEGTEQRFVLLSRRVPNPEEDILGFREQYYCTNCRDEFVLAWHSTSSPLVKECEVIPESHPCLRGTDAAQAKVFCPRCQADYAMYGPIQHSNQPLEDPEDAHVHEAFDYPLPPEVPSTPAGSIKIGSSLIEKVVLLVTGEFPPGMDVRDFAYSGFAEVIRSKHGGDFLVSEEGGIRLHVLRVNAIVDETAWLTPLLQREVYRTQSWGTKIFLTYGIMDLKPPLGQALFCVVLSDA